MFAEVVVNAVLTGTENDVGKRVISRLIANFHAVDRADVIATVDEAVRRRFDYRVTTWPQTSEAVLAVRVRHGLCNQVALSIEEFHHRAGNRRRISVSLKQLPSRSVK